MEKTKCPVCNLTLKYEVSPVVIDNLGQGYIIDCYRCGVYSIKLTAESDITSYFKSEKERNLLSNWIYGQSGQARIKQEMFEDLSKLEKPTVGERAVNLFLYMTSIAPELYQTIDCGNLNNQLGLLKVDYETATRFDDELSTQFIPFLSVSWSDNQTDVEYLIKEYLIKTKQYLELTSGYSVRVTPKGWMFLDDYYSGSSQSDIVFIAMKFNDDLVQYSRKWFETAIIESGYKPEAMYEHKHTSLIDNKMKALIRKSKFIIADLTENSRGAYYEAGFAHGLRKPVIFLCEEDYFDKKENKLSKNSEGVHFDTNHYPILKWQWKNGEKIKADLRNYIEGAIN